MTPEYLHMEAEQGNAQENDNTEGMEGIKLEKPQCITKKYALPD